VRKELQAVAHGFGSGQSGAPEVDRRNVVLRSSCRAGRPPKRKRIKKCSTPLTLEEEYQLLSGRSMSSIRPKVESASKYRMRLSGLCA